MDSASSIPDYVWKAIDLAQSVPWHMWLVLFVTLFVTGAALLYSVIFVAAPVPRAPRSEEERYITIGLDGKLTSPTALPCWQNKYIHRRRLSLRNDPSKDKKDVEAADVFVSLVVPAYNEEKRIGVMLEEATEFLEREYGSTKSSEAQAQENGTRQRRPERTTNERGWEILVVSDGSTDKTADVALDYARRFPGGRVRVVNLVTNRGKGGAVTHGMRHVRGQYAVFADADGASRFADLRHLIAACSQAADEHGRAVAVGSRAHLVGSDAVVKRSALRNFLMHSFHVLLRLLTPPATSRIKDTQCGFKLFSRASLPYIVPHMHSEGWIFDVEMLMLAEVAQIPMVEVPIGWKEVKGSKLNVIWDSLGMAWGLAILRAAWAVGVYRVS
ncbi:hypothetical protein FH972_023813 [Carpinus fangiana]|uniref:dolichyl-phosphate beta-glucosyltransferase n=1 Tax=Carpinus fangiana TaxID=176857 RepID=A0A5N6KYR7_9ROSI|nr:hypothetical protein FH972_023813 [Carpinus fangiana]